MDLFGNEIYLENLVENDFAEDIYKDIDLKRISLNCQNNYVECSNMINNATKSFDINSN